MVDNLNSESPTHQHGKQHIPVEHRWPQRGKPWTLFWGMKAEILQYLLDQSQKGHMDEKQKKNKQSRTAFTSACIYRSEKDIK